MNHNYIKALIRAMTDYGEKSSATFSQIYFILTYPPFFGRVTLGRMVAVGAPSLAV
jgi:hypothetical protein